jgi:hypothetical protein
MGMHVQRVNRKVVRSQIQGLEDLFQCKFGAVAENDDVLLFDDDGDKDILWLRLTLGLRFILDLMKRRRCFWFMLLE